MDEEMTIPRVRAFRQLWRDGPPLRYALGALLRGLGGGPSEGTAAATGATATAPPRRGLQDYVEAFGAVGLALADNRRGAAA